MYFKNTKKADNRSDEELCSVRSERLSAFIYFVSCHTFIRM